MRHRLPLGLVILLLAFCFGLGLLSALLARSAEGDEPPPSSLPAPREEQVNFLIVGVDEIASPRPALTALWVASFEPPGRDLFLTGIPIDASAPALDGAPVAGAFAWSSEAGPSAEFLAAVASLAPLELDVVISLDRQGFAAVVDYIGGIELNGARLDGAQVVAVLELLEEDPSASVASQRRVLESMAARAAALGDSPDITPLISLIPDHARLSMPLNQVVSLTAPLLPLDASALHFDLFIGREASVAD